MSKIPEKQIKWLYERVRETGEQYRFNNWKLKVDYETMPTGWTGEIFTLYHYDIAILIVEDGEPHLMDGWSVSDRDGINSLLILMCLSEKWRASIINGHLQLLKL